MSNIYNLRSRSEMSESEAVSLSEDLRTYLSNLISPLVTSQELKESLETFASEVLGKVNELEKRLTEKEKIISENQKTIEVLTSQLAVTRNALDVVTRTSDDIEQYTRRYSLRINGLEVKDDENVMDIVKECYDEMGVEFNPDEIDRAHRSDKAFFDKDRKVRIQPILVKFRHWDGRLKVYKARPKFGKEKPGGKRKFTVTQDLTTRRFNLLKYARERLQSGNYTNVKFAFADVNCSLGLRLANGKLVFFNTKERFHDLIGYVESDQ